MEPIRNRWRDHTGVGQNGPQTGTAVGERDQLRLVGAADRLQVAADQHRDVGLGPRDSAEHWPASVLRLDVADANLQVSFAVVAAANEGRIQGDGDGRRCDPRLDRGGAAKSLPGPERVAAQRLRALSGLHRQKMLEHASGDAIRHQRGQVRPQLVQLRGRATMWRPAGTRLGAATASAEKSGKPHRHPTEQRRDLAQPPVLDMASPAAGRAVRPQSRMIASLRGSHRLLNPRQKPLCLGQGQPQVRDITKIAGPADLQHIDTSGPAAVGPRFDQLHNPPHARSPSRRRPSRSYRFRPCPPSFWTLPKLRSTNPLERLNKEVKRRADVVGIFPGEQSIVRLIGAVLLEANDEWQLQHRYMQTEAMAELLPPLIEGEITPADDPQATPQAA
jgi:hypothetical protein